MIRKLSRSEWREFICDDLWPVLTWLKEQHDVSISEVILDIKGVYTDVYVTPQLTPEVIEAASTLSVGGQIRTGGEWISCPQHYVSIQTADRKAAQHSTR